MRPRLRRALVGAEDAILADAESIGLRPDAWDIDVDALAATRARDAAKGEGKDAEEPIAGDFLHGLVAREPAIERRLDEERQRLRELGLGLLVERLTAACRTARPPSPSPATVPDATEEGSGDDGDGTSRSRAGVAAATAALADAAHDAGHADAAPSLRSHRGWDDDADVARAAQELLSPLPRARRVRGPRLRARDADLARANAVWGERLGYDAEALRAINRRAVDFVVGLREETAGRVPVVVSGNIGPLADGYSDDGAISASEAREAHAAQVAAFAASDCGMLSSLTLTNAAEAIGLAEAARAHAMPLSVGFTVETDGRLPSGQPLGAAIAEVDRATDAAPLYYVVDCAHPEHFADVLGDDATIARRVRGIRANASRLSHAELDASETLDEGDPDELGALYAGLARSLPRLAVVGGCCGTDIRHVERICKHTATAAAG